MTRAEEDAMETPLTNALFDQHVQENLHCAQSEKHHLAVQQVKELLDLARRLERELAAAGKEAAETEMQHNKALAIVGRELTEAKAAAAKAVDQNRSLYNENGRLIEHVRKLESAAAKAREDALEEAAKVCEQMRPVTNETIALQRQRQTLDNAALLIRALRGRKDT